MPNQNKILVICNLQKEILEKYSFLIEYLPSLSECSLSTWEDVIKVVKPKVVLFGTGYFTKKMISIWRKYLPDDQLSIVRKGVSLSRCDLDSAKHYSINVLNTPGINSKYVADYMSEFLFKETSSSDRVAIIGVGRIGTNIIREAKKNNAEVILYSRSLRNGKLNLSDISDKNIPVATSIEQALSTSNKIAISIPLDEETKGSIGIDHINLIQNDSVLVSVSSPQIFTHDALRHLYERRDICVVIDHLKSEFEDVYKVIGHKNTLRSNFLMDEKAAAGPDCQKAMGLAAIEICLTLFK